MTGAGSDLSELLARAKRGDARAGTLLFERLAADEEEGAVLLRMARRLLPRDDHLRDFVESRDLLQSALKSGWLDLASFEGETLPELLAWLRTILRRKIGRVARHRWPRPAGDAVESAVKTAAARGTGRSPGEDEPLAGMIREEVKARVRIAVKRLPDHERAVMDMRLRGLDAVEIAEILGIEPAAVRKRESRAMARLRAALKEDAAG